MEYVYHHYAESHHNGSICCRIDGITKTSVPIDSHELYVSMKEKIAEQARVPLESLLIVSLECA